MSKTVRAEAERDPGKLATVTACDVHVYASHHMNAGKLSHTGWHSNGTTGRVGVSHCWKDGQSIDFQGGGEYLRGPPDRNPAVISLHIVSARVTGKFRIVISCVLFLCTR